MYIKFIEIKTQTLYCLHLLRRQRQRCLTGLFSVLSAASPDTNRGCWSSRCPGQARPLPSHRSFLLPHQDLKTQTYLVPYAADQKHSWKYSSSVFLCDKEWLLSPSPGRTVEAYLCKNTRNIWEAAEPSILFFSPFLKLKTEKGWRHSTRLHWAGSAASMADTWEPEQTRGSVNTGR